MNTKISNNILTSILLALILGLGGWVMSINARTAVLEEQAYRNEIDRSELKYIIRENTKAITDLKEYLIMKGE